MPEDGEPVDPVFDNNPGKTAEIVNMQEHPYVKGVCKVYATCPFRKSLNLADAPNKPECGICKWVQVHSLTWERKIALDRKVAEKVIKNWATTIEREIKSSSLKSKTLKLSINSVNRFVGHGRTSEEKLIITSLPENIDNLKQPKYSKLGQGKNMNDPKDRKNIQNKRKRGVTWYFTYTYEFMGKTWIIGMEIINNGQYEQPYFIKPLKNKKTR